jgi:hypothetical protein
MPGASTLSVSDDPVEEFLCFLSFLVQGKRGPDFPENYEPLNGFADFSMDVLTQHGARVLA